MCEVLLQLEETEFGSQTLRKAMVVNIHHFSASVAETYLVSQDYTVANNK